MNKTKLLLTSSTLAALFIFFISCDKKVGKLPVVVPPPVTAGFCDTITYNKHIKPIIASNCSTPGCHVQNGGPGNFTLFGELSAKIGSGKFKNRVFDSPSSPMPASGMLPAAQLAIIKCWLDKGAPEN